MKPFSYRLHFILYRYRFLLLYTLYGGIAVAVELVTIRGLEGLGFPFWMGNLLGVIGGITFAFWMNVRFNFKIAKPKRNRALLYFVAISASSWSVQFVLRMQIQRLNVSYDLSRIVIAGGFFLIAYFFHRKYSFNEYKQVGVAIYADGVEDIGTIYEKILDYSDFIHIDIVDRTFRPDCPDTKAYRVEVVRAYWRNKPIETHIMSKTPSVWLPFVLPHVDRVFVHTDIDEDHSELFQTIRDSGCQPGIAVSIHEDLNGALRLMNDVNHILLLSIADPGLSGQAFEINTLERIGEVDQHSRRKRFVVTVDGGVNRETVGLIKAGHVVSGSYVLRSDKPTRQIMLLQTSSQYDSD